MRVFLEVNTVHITAYTGYYGANVAVYLGIIRIDVVTVVYIFLDPENDPGYQYYAQYNWKYPVRFLFGFCFLSFVCLCHCIFNC